MKLKILITFMAVVCALSAVSFGAFGEEGGDFPGGLNLGNIEITIDGIPMGDFIETFGGMFVDALEESLGQAITDINGVLEDFAADFSADLAEIEALMESMQDEFVPIEYFCYYSTGSSTDQIYTYEVAVNEETGETEVNYELNCGYECYTVPATGEFMLKLNLLTKVHELDAWNGFNESDSMVLDGYGFGLDMRYADQREISAHGSNSFPGGYNEASSDIDKLFLDYLEEQGIERELDY